MSKEKEQLSSREQRHRERARRWRRQRMKSLALNFTIIVVAVAAIFVAEWIGNKDEVVVDEYITPSGVVQDTTPTEPEEETPENPEPEMVSLPITKTAPTLSDGEVMILTENCIRKNKTFTFTANVDIMGVLVFRHGDNVYGASWINLDKEKVEIYTHSDMARKQLEMAHGLTFGGELKVEIKVDANERMDLTITSGGKRFVQTGITWMGYRGAVEVESIGNELIDITTSWDCKDIEKDIWVLGDDYLGTSARNKWPYYVLGKGYDNVLYSGLHYATSERMYEEWQRLLTYGTPKYAVWCLGVNDSDIDDRVNAKWKEYTDQFLEDCENKGITPILATIPNTTKRNHEFKNEIVRQSGHRYVDFALVVGASKKDSVWLGGMLSGDNVHPTNAGAEALAQQFLKDVPEIQGLEYKKDLAQDEEPQDEETQN